MKLLEVDRMLLDVDWKEFESERQLEGMLLLRSSRTSIGRVGYGRRLEGSDTDAGTLLLIVPIDDVVVVVDCSD